MGVLISRAILFGWVLGIASLLSGCGAKEPTEQAKADAKKEADAQLESAAELYRKRQAGPNR